MALRITVHSPASAEALAIVDSGLHEFNKQTRAVHDVKKLHVIATDDDGKVTGGAIGRSWGKCCELLELWVAPERRGRNEGTELLQAFEQEAKRRGCELVYLDTFSFQAPVFYGKLGYVEVLRTEGYSDGVVKITMQKQLAD